MVLNLIIVRFMVCLCINWVVFHLLADEEQNDLQKEAETGNPTCQFELATKYFDQKKYDLALQWFQRAADQGFAPAQYKLGVCFLKGYGTNPDPYIAAELFKKAAEKNYPDAQYALGVVLLYGNQDQKNPKEAITWLEKTASNGHVPAESRLGECYLHGLGVEKNPQLAVKFLTQASEQGDRSAQENLGTSYMLGNGVPQDYTCLLYTSPSPRD